MAGEAGEGEAGREHLGRLGLGRGFAEDVGAEVITRDGAVGGLLDGSCQLCAGLFMTFRDHVERVCAALSANRDLNEFRTPAEAGAAVFRAVGL